MDTNEGAKKAFDKYVATDKEDNFGGVYNIEDSMYEWDEATNGWAIWESGNYASNHSTALIAQIALED